MNIKSLLIDESQALPGREVQIKISPNHFVNDNRILEPFPNGIEVADFGLGCFWGAERIFWSQEGIFSTAVGYMGGYTKNPTYEEVCSGMTGHTEVVRVFFDPSIFSYKNLLELFWESHNPTQGMRQGNDMGTQYRSAIYTHDVSQTELALESKEIYQKSLIDNSYGMITTEIRTEENFYYAEEYHQQYLAKNPNGYCGIGGLGISCKI
tara:strand:+ start:125 stop:751 length:627 start_codon:yes stop_codon:yes gene_type:complete